MEAGVYCPACFDKRLQAKRRKRAAPGLLLPRASLLLDCGLEDLAPELHQRHFTMFQNAIDRFMGPLRTVITAPVIITRRPEHWVHAAAVLQSGIIDVAELSDEEIPAALDWFWAKLHLEEKSSFLLKAKSSCEHCLAALEMQAPPQRSAPSSQLQRSL